MGRWRDLAIIIACLSAASWAPAADVLIDDFNGAYPYDGNMIEEDWGRAFVNGTWWGEDVNVTSPPHGQMFYTAVGDTCRFCGSGIQHGGEGATFLLRSFAPDIDATKPWSLTCNVFGHNDTRRPDHFLQFWSSGCEILSFSNASKAYGPVYWTSESDRTWQQITFKTNGSTSGDDMVQLFLVGRWGYAEPVVDSSFMVFDDLWLTYTPDNGDVTPPGLVTGFTATRGDGSIELAWQNPSDADFAGTVIRVRTDHVPVTRTDGDLVIDLPGSPGAQESLVHQPTDNEKSYYYAAYTYDNRTVPAPSYTNYSEAATAAVPGPVTPTVDADISLVETLGWDVVNHGDAASPSFNDSAAPTTWDTTTPTPSGDNLSAEIDTVASGGSLKWREQTDLSSTSGTSMFFVWKPREGLRCGAAGVWGSSAYTIFEIRTASISLKANADSALSWPPGNLEEALPVPDGLIEIGLHDSVSVENGGLGTQFDTFTIESDKWQRWWFQVDENREFKLYDLNEVVPAEGPHLLASGQLGLNTESCRITLGDGSSTAGIDSDFLVDEVYVLDSFRDVSEVPFGVPPDFDGDSDVDEQDLLHFEDCASGPAVPQTDPPCRDADLDHDEDVDQEDFAVFQGCYSGQNNVFDTDCLPAP